MTVRRSAPPPSRSEALRWRRSWNRRAGVQPMLACGRRQLVTDVGLDHRRAGAAREHEAVGRGHGLQALALQRGLDERGSGSMRRDFSVLSGTRVRAGHVKDLVLRQTEGGRNERWRIGVGDGGIRTRERSTCQMSRLDHSRTSPARQLE